MWLKEGFATYFASLGVEYLHPEWNSFQGETVLNALETFEFDSLLWSHPMSKKIWDHIEISQIYDTISYEKGSSIIRMMHLFLGEEAFRLGVSSYLKKHKYGSAEPVTKLSRSIDSSILFRNSFFHARITCGTV